MSWWKKLEAEVNAPVYQLEVLGNFGGKVCVAAVTLRSKFGVKWKSAELTPDEARQLAADLLAAAEGNFSGDALSKMTRHIHVTRNEDEQTHAAAR